MTIVKGQEVGEYIDFDQFGLSQDTCGFASVILNHFASEHGTPYGASVGTLQTLQKLWYTRFDGADVASNHDGMTLAQLYKLIVDLGNHYQNLYPDGGVPLDKLKEELAFWIANGYPVIIAILEDSVFDVGLGGKPYSWNTSGLSHIITVTGIADNGNVLVRDTANVGRPGPREYDLDKLAFFEPTGATVFVPHWQKRPYNAWFVDAPQPTQIVPIPAPVTPAPQENYQAAFSLVVTINKNDGKLVNVEAKPLQP